MTDPTTNSGEPSERVKFEAWAEETCGPVLLSDDKIGYVYTDVRAAWRAWQARAAITPAPAQPEPPTDEFERGRQQGMKQERALWKLAAEGQAIEAKPPTAAGVEPGWETLSVKNLGPLLDALDRADSKGYMPDAMADEWAAFDCRPATPPTLTDAQWPIRGVRVEGDTVIVTVKGGNDAARRLCGELLARRT